MSPVKSLLRLLALVGFSQNCSTSLTLAYCPRPLISDIAISQDSTALSCLLANTLHHSIDHCPFFHSRQLTLSCYMRLRETSLMLMNLFKLRPLQTSRLYFSKFLALLAVDTSTSCSWLAIAKNHTKRFFSFISINQQQSNL